MGLIKKIAFIEPLSSSPHVYSKFKIPRLGSILLATILRDKGYEVKVFIENIEALDWAFIETVDIVCISTITSTVLRAYDIAERVKKMGITVVMGGAHPTFLPEESLEYADYVVRGEGDYTLPELIKFLDGDSLSIESIKGISYKNKSNEIVHNPSRPLLDNMDILPIPDFSLIHGWKHSNIYPISTSRGCPFNCKFCSVIAMFGRKYRFESVEVTLRKLRHVVSTSKADIFFVDDNFTANKERTKEILTSIISEKLKMSWSAQARVDITKDTELLRLMADSGCSILYIGFESINPKTLEIYNKKQDIKDIIECIKVIKDHGIKIHGMFVLGADTDDIDTIKKTTEFAKKTGIDTVQFMILTPLPGTPIFNEMRDYGRLLHTNWSKYDGHHVVFAPALIPPDTLHIETLKAMARFYSWNYIFRHLIKFDFYYTLIGLYGKKSIKYALDRAKEYIETLQDLSIHSVSYKKQANIN